MEENGILDIDKNDVVHIDNVRARAGLSFAVFEDNDVIFNKRLREYTEKKDYRYAATAIRNEPERLDRSTRELIAQTLEAASTLNPRHRPNNFCLSKTDRRNRIIREEAEELKRQGVPAQEINDLQFKKYGPGSGYDPPIGSLGSLQKARKAVPVVLKRAFDAINKK